MTIPAFANLPSSGAGAVSPTYQEVIAETNLMAQLSPTGTDAAVGGANPAGYAWNGVAWVSTATGLPANAANAAAMGQQVIANPIVTSVVTPPYVVKPNLVPTSISTVSPVPTGIISTPVQTVVPVTTPVTTTPTTVNSPNTLQALYNWLGLSSTPSPSMITGIPNWLLAAGGIGLLAFLANEGEI